LISTKLIFLPGFERYRYNSIGSGHLYSPRHLHRVRFTLVTTLIISALSTDPTASSTCLLSPSLSPLLVCQLVFLYDSRPIAYFVFADHFRPSLPPPWPSVLLISPRRRLSFRSLAPLSLSLVWRSFVRISKWRPVALVVVANIAGLVP
jgi:hypothetical protein